METQTEIFKDIIGYENKYQINNFGSVKALNYGKRKCIKIMCNSIDTKGYYKVTLSKNNFKITHRIHRLIAIHFIPNPENKKEINHINGIRTDNRIENLEWVTRSENAQHSYDSLNHKRIKGINHPKSKKIMQYDRGGNLINTFNGMREAGRETNIDGSAIGKCAQGLRPSAGGYIWKYEK